MSVGIVLSGGGARGAYEAGVLGYAFGELARELGRPPRIDVVCGTSVGAVNGTFLASVADDPSAGIARLVRLWSEIRLGDVLDFSLLQAARLWRVVLGSKQGTPAGLLDARPMAKLIAREVRWRRLSRNLRNGTLRALTITTTHVPTGRPYVWVDAAAGTTLTGLPPNVIVREEHVRPEHVLASAAIPLVFPPVPVDEELHCDGGLRLNTPMAPAIQLGVTRMLVLGMATGDATRATPSLSHGQQPGAAFLIGKMLNAFLLDHVRTDLEDLERINAILEAGEHAFGGGFLGKLEEAMRAQGHTPRRRIETVLVRPSEDLGRLAGDHLRRHRIRFGKELGTTLLRLLDLGEGADADLASYLLFDGSFARTLVELGRADARAQKDALVDLLYAYGKGSIVPPPPRS